MRFCDSSLFILSSFCHGTEEASCDFTTNGSCNGAEHGVNAFINVGLFASARLLCFF